MRRKKVEAETTAGSQGRITPTDVQQVQFRLAFRGYNERDVDAFLDRLTEDLAAYQEENERLRAAGPAAGPSADDPAARREAERILAEARAEAARIIGDAEVKAAAMAGTAGDTRAALAPFLTKERAFLQTLGSLVQGHAEEVKGMVLTARTASDLQTTSAAEARTPSAMEVPDSAQEEPDTLEGRSEGTAPEATSPEATSEDTQTAAASEDAMAPADEPSTTPEEAFAPITVPEAQDDEPRDEPAPAQLRRDSGERSLRELFWGED